jgi:hypothetical protein
MMMKQLALIAFFVALCLFLLFAEKGDAFIKPPPAENGALLPKSDHPILLAQARRRRKAAARKKKPAAPKAAPAQSPATEENAEAATPSAPAPAPSPEGLQRGGRVEFDGRLVQGQTAKSGAIYLFARQRTNLQSMVREREDFRKEILSTVNSRWAKSSGRP